MNELFINMIINWYKKKTFHNQAFLRQANISSRNLSMQFSLVRILYPTFLLCVNMTRNLPYALTYDICTMLSEKIDWENFNDEINPRSFNFQKHPRRKMEIRKSGLITGIYVIEFQICFFPTASSISLSSFFSVKSSNYLTSTHKYCLKNI